MWRKPHIDIGKWYILVLTIAFQENIFPYFFFLHNVESWLIKVTSTSVGFWPALRSANWRSCAEKTKRAKCQLEGHHRDQIQVVLEIIKLFFGDKKRLILPTHQCRNSNWRMLPHTCWDRSAFVPVKVSKGFSVSFNLKDHDENQSTWVVSLQRPSF